ncbi:transposable element Tcb1 transposase [Trichonephila clavipes]|nr:transposable element Tcb1 transposase [Trichonephila clavipes]
MQICHRWMKEETTDRRGRSHPPLCTTAHDGRQIVRMTVMDCAATSRATVQQIQSVIYASFESTPTIRRHLQQSGMFARRTLLRLPLAGNHMHLCRQWCDERWTWTTEWNDLVFTDKYRFCLQHHDSWIRVWRHRGERLLNCCVMHCHFGPSSCIMVWCGIEF